MAEYLIQELGWWPALAYFAVVTLQAVLIINVVAVGALLFIWMERKVSGRIQDRLGPTRVGGKFGWLQTLADGIKLIAKEDLTPEGADSMLFKLAPYISFTASYAAYIALPFSDGWVAQHLNTAVFFVLAVMGLEVFGVILAGYASASKWSLFGAMREAAQVVSYEVPIALCVIVPVMICGTMNLVTIGNMQTGWASNWLVFHDPFTFVVFWVFFTCAVASVNRAPFDLAEAESELVAGFHTEYSGLRWSIFFMAEYGSMFIVGGLTTILFFGGWNGPIPIFHLLGWADAGGVLGWVANLFGCVNFIAKSVFWVTVMMWVRWTLPRLRIDQVITMCWKYCVPLSCVCFVGVLAWQGLNLPSPNDLGAPRGSYRELWAVLPEPEEAQEPAPETEPPVVTEEETTPPEPAAEGETTPAEGQEGEEPAELPSDLEGPDETTTEATDEADAIENPSSETEEAAAEEAAGESAEAETAEEESLEENLEANLEESGIEPAPDTDNAGTEAVEAAATQSPARAGGAS